MSTERLPELFDAALDLDPSGRERLLAGVAREDAALAERLAGLLAAADAKESPLDRSPWRRPGLAAGPLPAEEEAASVPQRIGAYRVVRELGRGGMGRVFLAVQEGEGFTRPVALKVVVPSGQGAEVERRFREERRILAGLEHPGIARFYDAGRAADGGWFLALEYVEGEDLLTFVRRRELDLRARVEIFLQVLDAVDFAHRRLVVHRDLKPGNVMVGVDGRVKLLDFGISKILDAEAADDATATRTELRAFTPAYASPEQLRGERATVATDVYSLGVVLYEILAGRRPFERRPGMATERDPEPPSAASHWRDLRGDLDAIVLKALRPEAESRYPSAAAFADDLRRWLAGEPVDARRGGRRYRLAKLVGRHRLALAAAAAILLTLLGGLSVALVQRSRALAAQGRAEAAAADLHRLTQSMLVEIYEEVRRLPGSLNVSQALVTRATESLDRLAAMAGDDPRMLAELAAGYEQLGQLFGTHPALGASLGQPRLAVQYAERAVAIRDRLAARPGAGFSDRLAAARSKGTLAEAKRRTGDVVAFERLAEEGIRRLSALEPKAPDRAYLRYQLAVAHGRIRLWTLTATGPLPPDDRHLAAAARLWHELAFAPPPAALADERFPTEVWLATIILLRAGDPEAALRLTNLGLASLDRQERGWGAASLAASRRANVLTQRASVFDVLHRPAAALADWKEVLRLRAASPLDPDDLLADAIRRLSANQKAADLAVTTGDLDFADQALAEAERLLAEAEAHFGAGSFVAVRIQIEHTQGDVLARRAEKAAGAERHRLRTAALAVYRRAFARAEALGGSPHGIAPEDLTELRRLAKRPTT